MNQPKTDATFDATAHVASLDVNADAGKTPSTKLEVQGVTGNVFGAWRGRATDGLIYQESLRSEW
jgi:hypothetical protein